jgi:D-alanyl-D-alanine carboxypeptidase/D-alanyl-D-alanine-endopeptidase (penicillin-binding protein 4)
VDVPDVDWKDEVTTGAQDSGDGVVIHGGEKTNAIHLRGTVPLGAEKFAVNGACLIRCGFATHQFSRARRPRAFKSVAGKASTTEPKHSNCSNTTSPPLIEIIKSIHASFRQSRNRMRLPHARREGGKATRRRHSRALEGERSRIHRPAHGGRLRSGACRLHSPARSRPSAVSSQAPARKEPPTKGSLLSKDGLRWKGGAMSGIRTFTGYAQSKSGEEFCYAFMVNHYTDGKAVSELSKRVMDAMLGL